MDKNTKRFMFTFLILIVAIIFVLKNDADDKAYQAKVAEYKEVRSTPQIGTVTGSGKLCDSEYTSSRNADCINITLGTKAQMLKTNYRPNAYYVVIKDSPHVGEVGWLDEDDFIPPIEVGFWTGYEYGGY